MSSFNLRNLQRGISSEGFDENGHHETWKLISHPRFVQSSYGPAVQFVSSLGRLRRFSGELINPTVGDDGYERVGLGFVHEIVLYTFVGPPPVVHKDRIYYSIDHQNRKRTDNRLVNLRWTTLQEQLDNRFVNGKQVKPAKLTKDYTTKSRSSKQEDVYESFIYSTASVDDLAEFFELSVNTARTYINKQFRRKDRDIDPVLWKLGLTTEV